MQRNNQRQTDQISRWDKSYHDSASFFGTGPSIFGERSTALLRDHGVVSVLELGCGQGRDTIAFARSGLEVTAMDYSANAVADTRRSAATAGVSELVRTRTHDLRQPLPFPDSSFDACYSHMLLCMELSTTEIARVLREIHRVLKPGGLVLYSVRSNFDKHFGKGVDHGDGLFEIDGFVVHFFSEAKIRRLAKGFGIQEIERIEEGRLPRDLFCVTMKKTATPDDWDPDPREETGMSDPLDQFQVFMDVALAPGVLDNKTKQLVALGAALAAGCDP